MSFVLFSVLGMAGSYLLPHETMNRALDERTSGQWQNGSEKDELQGRLVQK
jgi:hypothetical protein